MARTNITCTRCGRAPRGRRDLARWNATVRRGVITETNCPDCLTTAEDLEAQISEATTTYGKDVFGRFIGTPKGVA